jgi:anti-sigma-K factor RskA
MTDAPLPPMPDEEGDLLAAEYVLGVLDLADRAAAEARLRRDISFAAAVAAWENRLADLNEEFAPVPAPEVFARIEARLFPQPEVRKRGWLSFLMGAATAAVAVVAVVAFLILTPADPSLTAVLTADASPLRYEAVIAGDELTLTRVAGDAAAETQDYELWIIVDDAAPVSLGVLTGQSVTLPTPEGAAAGYVLAITLETLGGSPTGAPQGPVVAAGPLTEV